jgi:hypothetical protein
MIKFMPVGPLLFLVFLEHSNLFRMRTLFISALFRLLEVLIA